MSPAYGKFDPQHQSLRCNGLHGPCQALGQWPRNTEAKQSEAPLDEKLSCFSGSVATDSYLLLAPAIVLRTISRCAGLASLALLQAAGRGQRSMAAIPRSV